ncbi:hypothetical protein M8037_32585 [Sinorhizobium meliloti]|uniref:hypothetical protein n=1 Tax=Rhizobium meliloti TaxID=382 RepID=UPI002073E817|nr:hypothetical protein [Sinorhizobium meliloti]MCM5693395.1 hypothetical protein [Sinorhizobium meliloti]
MTPIILLAVALSGAMCVVAFALATHALPFMLGLCAFRLVLACGAGVIVAGIVAIAAATLSFTLFVYLREVLRSSIAKLVLIVAYAAPAAVAGYSLLRGVIGPAPLSEPVKTFFCVASGTFVAVVAVLRLSAIK